MKTNLLTTSRRMLAVLMAMCVALSGNLSMVVTAVDTTSVQESQSVSNTVTELRNYLDLHYIYMDDAVFRHDSW